MAVAAFGGAPNERRVSPRERAKEEAKAKEVRVIGAKDLAEDRRMERRRLNKMLAIFDDQKPVN